MVRRKQESLTKRIFRATAKVLVVVAFLVGTLWATAALYIDSPSRWIGFPVSVVFLGVVVFVCWSASLRRYRVLLWLGSVGLVVFWWLSLRPSNNRNWQPDVAQLGWGELNGNRVTLHNVRNFDYVTETKYTPRWETKTVNLDSMRGVDIFLTDWGVPGIAHGMLSFGFADGTHLAVSIEARKEVGEEYSAVLGFFRQFETIYILSEERDVVRLRTNYRKGEYVYLYHTRTTREDARKLFLEYVEWMNQAREKPIWYNALTNNCVSPLVTYLHAKKIGGISRWDIRTTLVGGGDEMLYELGDLAGDLPFSELKKRALINRTAQANNDAPDFSARIRQGRPGFE